MVEPLNIDLLDDPLFNEWWNTDGQGLLYPEAIKKYEDKQNNNGLSKYIIESKPIGGFNNN